MDWLWNRRQRFSERMDEDAADPAELARSLAFIRRVNRLLCYNRATLGHLQRFSRNWAPGRGISIVDLATGSADMPRAILAWAQRHGHDIHIVGLDRHPTTAALAASDLNRAGTAGDGREQRLKIVRGDATGAPFADASFDYAMCSMFLHHLDEDDVVLVLREMDRLARRGIIVADLLRHRRAYLWIRLLTAFAGPMVRNDAPASVAQAFTKREILALRERAGVGYARYHRHWAHRFVLAGEKLQGDGLRP